MDWSGKLRSRNDLLMAGCAVLTALLLGACQRPVEAYALSGRALTRPTLSEETRAKHQTDLDAARSAFDADPSNETNIIWLGRRLAYLGRYRDAIDVYSRGLEVHPNSYKLLRHRGHRWITVREFDRAIEDLSRAAELVEDVPDVVEPDGMPNALNIPTSTSHTNIYYHLGLARYLRGEFDEASAAYESCLAFAKNDDMRCAASYWLYLSLKRSGNDEAALRVLEPITGDMTVIENTSYHRLLLLFKGELGAENVVPGDPAVGRWIDEATVAYGIGVWRLLRGGRDRALQIFRSIEQGDAWPAFGHIAAEAEVARNRDANALRTPSDQPAF